MAPTAAVYTPDLEAEPFVDRPASPASNLTTIPNACHATHWIGGSLQTNHEERQDVHPALSGILYHVTGAEWLRLMTYRVFVQAQPIVAVVCREGAIPCVPTSTLK